MTEDDDEVGYGKPPKHTQFKKGQSGNPSGRPKCSPNILDLYSKIRREPITVNEAGKTRKIPRLEALLRRHMQLALSGNSAAFRLMLQLEERMDRVETTIADPAESDALKIKLIKDFFKQGSSAVPSEAPSTSTVRPDNVIE